MIYTPLEACVVIRKQISDYIQQNLDVVGEMRAMLGKAGQSYTDEEVLQSLGPMPGIIEMLDEVIEEAEK